MRSLIAISFLYEEKLMSPARSTFSSSMMMGILVLWINFCCIRTIYLFIIREVINMVRHRKIPMISSNRNIKSSTVIEFDR